MPDLKKLTAKVTSLEQGYEQFQYDYKSSHCKNELEKTGMNSTLDKLSFNLNIQNIKQLELNRSFKNKIEE